MRRRKTPLTTLRSKVRMSALNTLGLFAYPLIPISMAASENFSSTAMARIIYAKRGATSSFWPGLTTRSLPADQTLSLMSTLKVIGDAALCDHRHVLPSTQAIGTPCSQVRPDPWPRRKTALPKPTSILTSMMVRAPEVDTAALTAPFGMPEFDFGALDVEIGALVMDVFSVGFRAAAAALFFGFIFQYFNESIHLIEARQRAFTHLIGKALSDPHSNRALDTFPAVILLGEWPLSQSGKFPTKLLNRPGANWQDCLLEAIEPAQFENCRVAELRINTPTSSWPCNLPRRKRGLSHSGRIPAQREIQRCRRIFFRHPGSA
jgi:hypothetical protein